MRRIDRDCARRFLGVTLIIVLMLASLSDILCAYAGVEDVVNKILRPRETKPPRYLDVWQCMTIALDQNKDVKEAWHLLQQTRVGDQIITRSRLFPQLEYIVGYTKGKEDTAITGLGRGTEYDDAQSRLRLSQRILEYGKDSPAEVELRASQRAALYNFESTVRHVLAQVRQNFYVILLREEQIAKRRELLEEFKKDRDKKKIRLEKKEPNIEPSDVLQAETNVLTEERSMDTLLSQQATLKMALLQLMGEPIGQNIQLVGAQDETVYDEAECVRIALQDSIEVARLQEELDEQKRVVRQIAWEFAPDLSLQTGFSNRGEDVALDLSNTRDTWALDVTGERLFVPGEQREQQYVEREDEDFFLNMEMRLPILTGFARVGEIKRERDRLKQAEARLERAKELAELNVRRSYEALLDRASNVRFNVRQVEISRRLFDIQNELREQLPSRVPEFQFEQFRNRYFNDQDRLFEVEASFIVGREALREAMGHFE